MSYNHIRLLTLLLAVTTAFFAVCTQTSVYAASTTVSPGDNVSSAISQLKPGETLFLNGGTYALASTITISVSGTASAPITISAVQGQTPVLDFQNKTSQGINIRGDYLVIDGLTVKRTTTTNIYLDKSSSNTTLRNLTVTEARKFGLLSHGQNMILEYSHFYGNVTENTNNTGCGGGWGSAIRVTRDSKFSTIRYNQVYQNWGEGISSLMTSNVDVNHNIARDNYSVNIYLDNVTDATISNNHTYSSDTKYYRCGEPPNCISLAQEKYDDWTETPPSRIKIINNLTYGCRRGAGYSYSEVSGGPGMDNITIANNTLLKSKTNGIYILNQSTSTKNNVPANNIIVNNIVEKGAFIGTNPGLTTDYNLWITAPPANASGPHDKIGDPRFAGNPTTNPATFSLSSSSPAINAGTASLSITKDYADKSRDSSPDIGAYEFLIPVLSADLTDLGDLPTDQVNINDQKVLVSEFGKVGTPGWIKADIDKNGKVEIYDYKTLVEQYGQ